MIVKTDVRYHLGRIASNKMLPKEPMNQESNYFLTVSSRILYAPPRTGRGVRYRAISLKRWGCSSAGRARRSQRRGQGFDPPHLHQDIIQQSPKQYKTR